jgi:hypothetical protein
MPLAFTNSASRFSTFRRSGAAPRHSRPPPFTAPSSTDDPRSATAMSHSPTCEPGWALVIGVRRQSGPTHPADEALCAASAARARFYLFGSPTKVVRLPKLPQTGALLGQRLDCGFGFRGHGTTRRWPCEPDPDRSSLPNSSQHTEVQEASGRAWLQTSPSRHPR